MLKRTMTIGAVMLLAATLAVPVLAQGPGRGGGKSGHGPGSTWNQPGPGSGSGLSEDQQARVDALRQKHYEETAPVRNKLQAKRAELRALMLAETVDRDRVKALNEEINALRASLSEERIELAMEIGEIDPNARFAGRSGRKGYGRHMTGGGFKRGQGYGACW